MKISLIILTYNRPDALSVVLKSVANQSVFPDEVIVADDGSADDTKELVETINKEFPVPIIHVWQPDSGFRIAAIRNKAVKKSSGEFLIFTDGDLILHPHFIRDFTDKAIKGRAFIGSRVFLSRQASLNRIQNQDVSPVRYFFSSEIEQNRLNTIRLTACKPLFGRLKYSEKLRGGLLGVWRDDLKNVNGWNEEFLGWGLEDSELLARLFFSGVSFSKIKFRALTYHLWHERLSRNKLSENKAILTETIKKKLIWCTAGLNL